VIDKLSPLDMESRILYDFLDTPFETNTAVLVSNYICKIQDALLLNISYMDTYQGKQQILVITVHLFVT